MSLIRQHCHASSQAASGSVGDVEELSLWKSYRMTGDQVARQALLEFHLPYARVVAASYFSRRMNDEIEFGDYLQLASIGLLEAFDRFEPNRGAGFRTFAARRMHGAILNGLEKLTEKQRQISARQRLESARAEDIKAFAEQVDIESMSEDDKALRYVAEVGLGFALAWLLDGTGMVSSGPASETIPFYRQVAVQQLRQRLRELVQELPEQERFVINRHYLQEQSFDEICASLNLTKGRISQIHRRALSRLRESLRAIGGLDVHW